MALHPASIFIEQNWSPNWQGLWVAATANRIEGEDVDYDNLIRYVLSRNVRLEDVAIAFFPAGIFQ